VRSVLAAVFEAPAEPAFEEAIERLGGPRAAARKLRIYLSLPGWAAPNKACATRALGHCGPHGAPILVELFRKVGYEDLRDELLDRGHAEEGGAVIALLSGEDRDPGAYYAVARLPIMGAGALPALREALKDPHPSVRYLATYTLGDMVSDARPAADSLIENLKDEEAMIRRVSSRVLGDLSPPATGAAEALKPLLQDTDATVRRAAAEALRQIRQEPKK
jgi:hypothetical protein